MSRTNDQTFSVDLSLLVKNYGDELTADQVEALLLIALDALPTALDYVVDSITVAEDEDED